MSGLMLLSVFFVTVLVALFAIMNPIGAVPTLVALTQGYSQDEIGRVIRRSVMVAAGMLFGFMFVGVYIFLVLGIDISDFKVAGGVLLFKVAFDMLQGRTSNTKLTQQEEQETLEREAIGIVPIGTPLLAGPGTITTGIIYFNAPGATVVERLLVVVAGIIVILLAYFILRFSVPLFNRLGRTGSLLISRIMGLLLASIAIEFITSGLYSIISSLH